MPTDKEKIFFKNKLKQWGANLVEQRIQAARKAMNEAQEAANSEEKSSAGDKYETGRAMGHLQKDMHAQQLAVAVQDLALLKAVPTDNYYREGASGAVLEAGEMVLFISVGLGKQSVGGRAVIFLSPQAPIAKQLLGKRIGDQIVFNQRSLIIDDIY